MPDTTATLLVISDDLFVSLTDSLDMVKWALFAERSIDPGHEAAKHQPQWTTENGCFVGSQYERLGAVAIFNFIPEKPYRYSLALFRNPHALEAVRVPAAPFSDCPLFDGPDWSRPRAGPRWMPIVLGAIGLACLVAAVAWYARER